LETIDQIIAGEEAEARAREAEMRSNSASLPSGRKGVQPNGF
jgi:hypothetical protein